MKLPLLSIGAALLFPLFSGAETLKINGSTTVNLAAAEAAEILRAEQKLDIQIDTQGGSTGGISALGDGLVQIAMSSRHVSESDRAKYPRVDFKEIAIGEDAVAMVVAQEVWEGGVKALSKPQVTDIFEQKVKNWKEVGGPDRRIVFLAREPGRGENEVFGKWLYGDHKKMPKVSHAETGGNEETRSKLTSTRGAVSPLSSTWADGKKTFAVALKADDGTPLDPSPANIASGKYPMSRPLFLSKPLTPKKVFW